MHNLNLDQLKHHAAIGGVALHWTHLENYVQSILWRMTKLQPNIGRCITHHMPFGSVCNAIVTVANETPEYNAIALRLEQLFRECDHLRIKRNDTVHALWATFLRPANDASDAPRVLAADQVEGMVIKARGRLNVKINSTTVSEIDDIIEEILTFKRKLSAFVNENLPE